jgi:hypothetical protein
VLEALWIGPWGTSECSVELSCLGWAYAERDAAYVFDLKMIFFDVVGKVPV